MRRVMAQGDFRPMAQNREAMSDLVAILDARSADYARAQAELDTSGDTAEQSFVKLQEIVNRCLGDTCMTALGDQGLLDLGDMALEYRMIGPRPDAAPTVVMLHEGLGCVGLWGDFPDKLQAATGAGVFVYSRAGYGQSSPAKLPRPLSFMHDEAQQVLPRVLDAIGFRRGLAVRPQRRRLDLRHLCGVGAGPSRARARADRAAFLHRGHGDCRDRARA